MNKKISIIIPVRNEEKNIPLLYERLNKVLGAMADFDFELIFINDGSADNSLGIISQLANLDGRVKLIDFSRNFGKEAAVSAGLWHCRSDAAILIDADLQHPVEKIPELVQKWREGFEVVVGVRKSHAKEPVFRKLGAYFYYKIMDFISEVRTVANSTDFRLIDRVVIEQVNLLAERNRMTRSLIEWLGYRRAHIYFEPNRRNSGKARYGFLKLVKLALSSFVASSLLPLKAAGYAGIAISFLSGSTGLFIMINDWILNDPWDLNFSNIAKLAVLNIFLIGIVLSCLGLIALYIGNIHTEVLGRPMYVIRNKSGFDNDNF